MKIRQIYYCVNTVGDQDGKPCKRFKKVVPSWLTPDEANRLLDGGMRCIACKSKLKWVRSEPVLTNPGMGREG